MSIIKSCPGKLQIGSYRLKHVEHAQWNIEIRHVVPLESLEISQKNPSDRSARSPNQSFLPTQIFNHKPSLKGMDPRGMSQQLLMRSVKSNFGISLTGAQRAERDPSSSRLTPSQHSFSKAEVRVIGQLKRVVGAFLSRNMSLNL